MGGIAGGTTTRALTAARVVERAVRQPRPAEDGVFRVDDVEVAAGEIGVDQAGTLQVGVAEIRAGGIDAAEIGVGEIALGAAPTFEGCGEGEIALAEVLVRTNGAG
jgi:hypothetical protein